jgi:hypothetical protein
MKIKFVWNGIKVDGKLHRAWYSVGNLNTLNYPADTVTIYGRDYKPLPEIEGLKINNDSDMRTDYFENDRVRVLPNNQHYPAIMDAVNQLKAHNDKRWAKRGQS